MGGRYDHTTGTVGYYNTDGNGNITALVNDNGAVLARYQYDPYGNLLAKSGSIADANIYRFSSKEVHPTTGLIYYGFRWYDPNLQRWIKRDPIGEAGGLNLYGYVGLDLLDHPLQGGCGGVVGAGGDVRGKGLNLQLQSFHFHGLAWVIETSLCVDRSHPQGLP